MGIACMFAPALTMAQDAAVPADPEDEIAAAVLQTIPDGTRIALRPLRGPDSNLTETVARGLYEEILEGLYGESGGRHTVLSRERLDEVYQSCEEFYTCGDMAARLEAARADVEVICTTSPREGGLAVSCAAVTLSTTTIVGHGRGEFPLDEIGRGQDWPLAVTDIANQIDRAVEVPGGIGHAVVIDQRAGNQTDFGTLLSNRLVLELSGRFDRRARTDYSEARARAQLGYDDAVLPERPAYTVHGVLWHVGPERLSLLVELRHGDRTVALGGAEIDPASVMDGELMGSEPDGGFFTAVGEAVVSSRLDRASALRAARNLARARVVAQALGRGDPTIHEVVTEADAASLLANTLTHAIPYDESFEAVSPQGSGERVAVRLEARVRPLGSVIRPSVRARLEQSVYRTGEFMRLELDADARTYVGVFSWDALNRVARVYPAGNQAQFTMGAGERLRLPHASENRQLASAPLPGTAGAPNPEDHEMFLVLTSTTPIDFSNLGGAIGSSAAETADAAIDGTAFFQALSDMDLSRMALIPLSYQVTQ